MSKKPIILPPLETPPPMAVVKVPGGVPLVAVAHPDQGVLVAPMENGAVLEPVKLTAPNGDSATLHVEPEPPYKPPSLMVRWEDGSCGDAIREAQDLLRAEVEAAGQRVTGWNIGGVELDKERGDPKTPGHSKRLIGYEEGNINKPVVASVTHVRRLVTPKVDLEAKLEERWLRLTSASGPCGVEMLTTRGGQVVDRAKLHPEDMRDISVRKAERALQEFGG